MVLDSTVVAAGIGAMAGVGGTLLTSLVTTKQETSKAEMEKEREYLAMQCKAYSELYKGVVAYRSGDTENEDLQSALLWIHLYSSDTDRSIVEGWKRRDFRDGATVELGWFAMRYAIQQYYGVAKWYKSKSVVDFIYTSFIGRLFSLAFAFWAVSWSMLFLGVSVIDWVYANPFVWFPLFGGFVWACGYVSMGMREIEYPEDGVKGDLNRLLTWGKNVWWKHRPVKKQNRPDKWPIPQTGAEGNSDRSE